MTLGRSVHPSWRGMPRLAMLPKLAMLPGLAILVALAGCASGEPSYYTLTSSPGQPLGGGPATVEVRTPSVASYLDRDSIVRSESNHQLTLAPGHLWASPLPGMIGRTLTLDLAQRLPGSDVTKQDDAISTEAVARVELDVSRFMENAQGMTELTATISVIRAGSNLGRSQALRLTGMSADHSINAMAASLSELVGQVADKAAALCRTLPPGQN